MKLLEKKKEATAGYKENTCYDQALQLLVLRDIWERTIMITSTGSVMTYKLPKNKRRVNILIWNIRKITGKSPLTVKTIKNAIERVLSDPNEIKSRWKDYLEGLYNTSNPVNPSEKYQMTDKEPSILRVVAAIKRLKTGKPQDGIASLAMKHRLEGSQGCTYYTNCATNSGRQRSFQMTGEKLCSNL